MSRASRDLTFGFRILVNLIFRCQRWYICSLRWLKHEPMNQWRDFCWAHVYRPPCGVVGQNWSFESMRARDIGVNQQVTNQQEALIEIKIGLSPRCQSSLVDRHNALFILYVIDYNCLFIYFYLMDTQTPTQLWATKTSASCDRPPTSVRLYDNRNSQYVIIGNNFRDMFTHAHCLQQCLYFIVKNMIKLFTLLCEQKPAPCTYLFFLVH